MSENGGRAARRGPTSRRELINFLFHLVREIGRDPARRVCNDLPLEGIGILGEQTGGGHQTAGDAARVVVAREGEISLVWRRRT